MRENKDYAITIPIGNAIKGIAVLMMVFHHCYGFPGWIDDVTRIPTCMNQLQGWALSAKFCVSIFAFLTGWTYFHHLDKSCAYSLKKIASCLVEYGVLVAAMVALASLFCGYEPSLSGCVKELFPLGGFHKLMMFAWYIRFYLIVLLLLPFLAILLDTQGKVYRLVVLVFGLFALYASLVISGHGDDAYWLPCVISGYACAQYKVIERCVGCMMLLKIGLVIGVVAVVASCYLYRYFGYVLLGRFNAGALYAPFFCCGWIILYPYVQKIKIAGFLQILGKHSLNIWLLHGIFFSIPTRASFQRFAYAVDSPFYVLPFVVGVCLIASMLIKFLQKVCRRIIVEKMAGF